MKPVPRIRSMHPKRSSTFIAKHEQLRKEVVKMKRVRVKAHSEVRV